MRTISKHGKTSLRAFICGCSVAFLTYLLVIIDHSVDILGNSVKYIPVAYVVVAGFGVCFLYRHSVQIAFRAYALGACFGIGLIISRLTDESWVVFGWYFCLISLFHYSEYLTTAIINPKTLSLDSFLINHSLAYNCAAIFSWVEFILERWLYPDMKVCWVSYVGLLMCIGGEVLRKFAMLTARSNFTHIIQVQREEGHTLITHGIYSFMRHPSYVGWFWWSIGTQIVLCNPVCLIGYTVASWNFFNERIYEEEITLLNFFNEDYVRYQRKVGTGLPFIKGYRVKI